ncbi:hypothetical protein NliqN6_3748 [Naganishia liquefaciens]|uniref:Uncharacterized protein n=1 Tax=Naganishia liquefaciens TaxID=104408 RepID=A0A8H3TTP8_9TREE|nr:hypothetical protein NliqN6_3748 [Naganishia liquefaciens]
MSLFAKNYSLTASVQYQGEELQSPELGIPSRRTIGKKQSLSHDSLRSLEIPLSPAVLSKAKSLFTKPSLEGHGSLGIELDALSMDNALSSSLLSPSSNVPRLKYTSDSTSVRQEDHVRFLKPPCNSTQDAKIEYFTYPSRKASKHITIAIDPSALKRAKKEIHAQRKIDGNYATYDSCMEGARGHEKKSGTYPQGSEKAKHHLERSSKLFSDAIAFDPDQAEALIGKCRVVVALADCYQPVKVALIELKNVLGLLQDAQKDGTVKRRPKTITLQAKALMLLSSLLHELEHDGAVPSIPRIWKSEIGDTARQAMRLCEEVAEILISEAECAPRGTRKSATAKAIDGLMSLANSALQVGNLAPTQVMSDKYYAIVELALDRASTLILDAMPSSSLESSISNPFLTQIHLVSCGATIARSQHHFALGGSVNEDEFKDVISDLQVLSHRERIRAKSLRGNKAAAASTSAFYSLKQLADTRYRYACLLRQIWRKRKALPPSLRKTSTSSIGSSGSDGSSRRSSVDVTHKAGPRRNGSKSAPSRSLSYGGDTIPEMDETSDDGPRGLNSAKLPHNGEESVASPLESLSASFIPALPIQSPSATVETMSPRRTEHSLLKRPSFISPFDSEAALTAGGLASNCLAFEQRRGSWMPSGDFQAIRARRLSSIGLAKQDASISAWNRKASVLSISFDEGMPNVTSSALVTAAWNALGEAVKEYKISLTILSNTHFLSSDLAQRKSETLLAIADASLFKASLAPRLSVAAEKRTSLLVAAEVYATWAAREVGWASVIEGSKEAQATDKRTSSWRADEAGRMAVLTLLRVWWYRAASGPRREVDVRAAAKDAAEKVTRRLADRNGDSETLVAKFRYKILKNDGDLDTAENLFWSNVRQNLSV